MYHSGKESDKILSNIIHDEFSTAENLVRGGKITAGHRQQLPATQIFGGLFVERNSSIGIDCSKTSVHCQLSQVKNDYILGSGWIILSTINESKQEANILTSTEELILRHVPVVRNTFGVKELSSNN